MILPADEGRAIAVAVSFLVWEDYKILLCTNDHYWLEVSYLDAQIYLKM